MNDNKHWPSDIFLGGAISYFAAKTVTRFSPFMARHNIAARPLLRDGATGVALVRRF